MKTAETKAVREGEVKSPSQIADDHSTQLMAPFDLEACIQQLLRKQLLHEALLREICEKTKEVLMRESNVVHISAPVTVVGDIHGFVVSHLTLPSSDEPVDGFYSSNSSQFYDLIEIFRIGGYAPHTNYLFLGKLHPICPIRFPTLIRSAVES